MKKNKIKKIGLIILGLIVILGCLLFFYRVQLLKKIIPSVYQIGSIKMSIVNDTTFVRSRLAIKNNIFLKINIDTIKYEVSLFDKVYMKNQTFVGLVLPGNGFDTVDLMLKIPHAVIMKDIKKERKKEDSASYSLDVSIQYSSVFGKSEFPFYKSSKIKIPQPPELELVSVKYKKIRLKSLLAFIKIKITNHSPIVLLLNDIIYFIDIPKVGNLKGNYKQTLQIKPHGSSYVTLEVKMEIKNMLKTGLQILFNKDNYAYVLNLKATLESVYPYQESFQVDLVKAGNMELKK